MEFDLTLFDYIHRGLAHPILDAVLPVYREKTTWIPLYLLMVALLWRQYGGRRTLILLLCVGASLAVADQLAASVIKPWVGRPRPCAAGLVVRELVGCGGIFSFPSNHATNHFALAVVLSRTWLADKAAIWRILLYGWAGSISLAQVYVGKHYPADVLAGALLGVVIGLGGTWLYRRWAGRATIGPTRKQYAK